MVAYADKKVQGLFTDTQEVSFRGLETDLKKIPHEHSWHVGQNNLRNFMKSKFLLAWYLKLTKVRK